MHPTSANRPRARRVATSTAATLLATTAVLAALPATGSAMTFCVSKPGCVGKPIADVNLAAKEANNTAGVDRIEIGEGTFANVDMGFANWADPVEVVGAGRGKTILLPHTYAAAVRFSAEDSKVSDLTVQMGDKSASGLDLGGPNNTAERVEVIGPSLDTSSSDIGIILRFGGTVRDAQVKMPLHSYYANYGISLSPNKAGDPTNVPTLIENVTATGGYAIQAQAFNREVTVRQAVAKGSTFGVAISTPIPRVLLEDVAASAFSGGSPTSTANAVNIYGYDVAGAPTVVDLRHVTANAPARRSRGFSVQQQGNAPLTVNAVDSAFFGGRDGDMNSGSFDIELGGFVTGTQVHATRSAWRTTHVWVPGVQQGPAFSKIHDGGGNVDLAGHPGQQLADLNSGDLRPVAGSVLIDNGTPGALESGIGVVDASGSARLVDGDSDGEARRDIGAFEAPAGTSGSHVTPVALGTLCQVTVCPQQGGGGGGKGGNGGSVPPLPKPTSKVLKLMPKKARKEISGTASGHLEHVFVSITRKRAGKCQALHPKGTWRKVTKTPSGACPPTYLLLAEGTTAWKLKLKKELPKGRYVVTTLASGMVGAEAAPVSQVFKR